jgi:CheY-like chemotaxis protein
VVGKEVAVQDLVRILIIDDEDLIRRIGAASLDCIGGMEVVTAASGLEGLRKAVETRPDLVLLDVLMPGMDGEATLRQIRRHPATSRLPVVFLTAHDLPGELQRLHELGAAAVLTKPFDPVTLPGKLRALLEGH